jgi:hypothetical protein
MRSPPRAWFLPALAAAALAFVPFARPLALGECFFFRDITRTFFPIKRFVAEGLRSGEVRFWNPLLHEGVPLHLGPLSYPVDLLHALWVDERLFTLMLALHVPLGAAGFTRLAQRLGCGGLAAGGGAVVYALGGFSLSCLNLYVYVQAMAWAPLVALGILNAAERGGRAVASAALAVWLCASTSGVEVLGQALLLGLALGAGRERLARRTLRSLAAIALGLCLAAPAWLVSWAQLGGSARASGLPAAVVVAHSVDPWSLPQILVANWHGDMLDPVNRWWGENFFPLGFPYVLSLYLGASAAVLALVGALGTAPRRRRLVVLAGLALLVCLGRFVGLEHVAEALPSLRVLRFPVKAFFTVHTCAALLAAHGLQELHAGAGWRRLLAAAAPLAGALVAAPALPRVAPKLWAYFLDGFMPLGWIPGQRVSDGAAILDDAARGGVVAVGLVMVGALVLGTRLRPERGALALAGLVAADLLRAGAGLNPTVSRSFYRLSEETQAAVAPVRASGARVFSCDPESSPAYAAARSRLLAHDAWSFAVSMETLTPNLNVGFGVKTALSIDLTMMVPEARVLAPEQAGPRAVPGLIPRLKSAGVTRVLCVDPIESSELRTLATLAPRRIAPLPIHLYELPGSQPMRSLEGAPGRIASRIDSANRLEIETDAEAPATLVVRDAMAPGWGARIDGQPAPLRTVEGHYRGVDVPRGRHRVSLVYRPPGLARGLALALLGGALTVLLAVRGRRGGP